MRRNSCFAGRVHCIRETCVYFVLQIQSIQLLDSIQHIKAALTNSCGIIPTSEWVERRRREWDEHVTIMDAERLLKIPKDNIPDGRRSPGLPKTRWSHLISD